MNRFHLYFEYRYLIDDELQKYSPYKYNKDELYNAGIIGLFKAVDHMSDSNGDF